MTATKQNSEALRDLIQRADHGDFSACVKVARIYAAGDPSLGIEPNRVMAAQYYEKGAQGGDLPCMYGLAGTVLPDNPDKAISLLETCAKGKYIWALATLGDFYLRGRHVQKDNNRAFQYLQEYITLCRPDKVGPHTFKVRWDLVLYPICLLLGIGCEKDEKKARTVLADLAKLGNLSAADILHTGKLNDWMAAKRFNFDTKANGPMPLLNAADGARKQLSSIFSNKKCVCTPKNEAISKDCLSKFLQRSLIPGEPILMQASFPRIYTTDTFFRLICCLGLGRWIEYLMATNANTIAAGLPDFMVNGLYQYPQLPVIVLGLYGFFIFMNRMIRQWTTEIVLTHKRFIYKHGLFSVEMVQMNFWQIEHSDVTQSILGSFLDYGRVHIQSYSVRSQEDAAVNSRGMLVLPAISEPFLFSRLIEDNRQLPYKREGGAGAEAVPIMGGPR